VDQKSITSSKKKAVSDNLQEILRDRRESQRKVTPPSEELPRTGELKANQVLDLEKRTEKRKEQFFNLQAEIPNIQKQERLLFYREKEEVQAKVKILLEEIRKLANASKGLAKEVTIAASQVPVEPGTYHFNFFERLKETVILFRKRIEESATWLGAFNQRSKKRYWGRFKKSGAKFLLSQERYMSTQAG